MAHGSSTTSGTSRPGSCCLLRHPGLSHHHAGLDVTTLGVITLVYDVTTLRVITLVSYAHIVVAVIRTPSLQGRRPAFSTCSSHLAVVLIWYGPTVFLHVRTLVESSLDLTKAVTVLSTIVTPVLNPFIYTLRSEDVKDALRKAVRRT